MKRMHILLYATLFGATAALAAGRPLSDCTHAARLEVAGYAGTETLTGVPVLVRLSEIPPETKVHSVTKEQRRRLGELFKAFPVNVTGPRPAAESIVTRGGVDVKEVDPRTMASRIVPGLYFAGEVLDVDAITGGFNLQAAWSTAFICAKALAK
jgi:predicted flavoprotein YhiN